MQKIYDLVKKIARPTVMIGLLVVAVLNFILGSVNSPGSFMPFVANGFTLLFVLALYAIPAVLLLLKKDEEVKIFLFILVAFWVVQASINYLSSGMLIEDGYGTAVILLGIFAFIEGLLLLTCVVFFVLNKAFGINLNKLLNLFIMIATAFFFLVFVFTLVELITYENGWTSYFNAFIDTLFMPFIIVCSLVLLTDSKNTGSKEEDTSEEKEEPKEEAKEAE